MRGHILIHQTTRRHNSAFPYRNTFQHYHIHPNPNMVLYHDKSRGRFLNTQLSTLGFCGNGLDSMIICIPDYYALRNHHAMTNAYGRKAIYDALVVHITTAQRQSCPAFTLILLPAYTSNASTSNVAPLARYNEPAILFRSNLWLSHCLLKFRYLSIFTWAPLSTKHMDGLKTRNFFGTNRFVHRKRITLSDIFFILYKQILYLGDMNQGNRQSQRQHQPPDEHGPQPQFHTHDSPNTITQMRIHFKTMHTHNGQRPNT